MYVFVLKQNWWVYTHCCALKRWELASRLPLGKEDTGLLLTHGFGIALIGLHIWQACCVLWVSRFELIPAGPVVRAIASTAPAGWRCLCAPQVEKSCGNLFSYFMEVSSRTKQDGEGEKERWLILRSAGAFGLPRYTLPSVPSTRHMQR